MLWIGTALTLAVGVVVLLIVMFAKRAAGVEELGSVSAHWIAAHQVEAR